MGIEIRQKTVDVAFAESAKGNLKGSVVPANRKHEEHDKVLRLYFCLMGETSPASSPLAADYGTDGNTAAYRYDWMAGVTPVHPCYRWNWWDAVASERAVTVQLLIDPGESGCGFSEISAALLGLSPSMNTASWLERNSDRIADSLARLSDIAEPFNKIASNVMRTSAVMSGFIASEAREKKNWFLYRFVDEKRRCCAVEWNISRDVVHQYGPLLRGSIVLAFHGGQQPSRPLTLLLRPRLRFSDRSLDYQPPAEELEAEDPVALSIYPVSADSLQGK